MARLLDASQYGVVTEGDAQEHGEEEVVPTALLRWQRALVFTVTAFAACALLLGASRDSRNARRGVLRHTPDGSQFYESLPDQFFHLGQGSCVDLDGKHSDEIQVLEGATVLSDGSSPECEEQCRSNELCTGYMTHDTEDAVWLGGKAGKCGIFVDSEFTPTASDGIAGSQCFWRHLYQQKSIEVYSGKDPAIPKVIWSFWQNMAPKGSHTSEDLPPFIHMCVRVWRQLNPDHDVRVLDLTTMWKWLSPHDLPSNFKHMSIQHQSDLIRLALLAKHGGIWLDASAFTVKPMKEILSNKPNARTFFHMPSLWADPALKAADKRVSDMYHAYNWFLAAPANDTLIMRTRACVLEFMQSKGRVKGVAASGMFSKQQLEEMPVMGMGAGMGAYLSTDACMFRAVDEDYSMEAWWLSDKVRHMNPIEGLGTWWWMDMPLAREVLFDRQNATFADELTGKGIYVLKFNGPMRHFITDGVSADALWCKHNTWHMILEKIGASNKPLCESGADMR